MTVRSRTYLASMILGASALLVIGAVSIMPKDSSAGTAGTITGYAWSDTIGWISLSGSNYGLSVGTTGAITGYAWSDNIGWVSAQSTDVSGCPSAPCAPTLANGSMSGWLKAIAASGGWDGWISLKGSTYGPTYSGTTGAFSGYAWGSDVVGWVDFSQAQTSYRDTCSPSYACTAGNLYQVDTSCGQTFIRACLNGCMDTTQCNPECTPSYSCSDSTHIQYTDAACNTSPYATCTAPSACVAGSSSCVFPPPVFNQNQPQGTSGHLTARPNLIRAGDTAKIYWSLSNVSSCSVTAPNGDSWTGGASGMAGKTTSPLTQQMKYTMQCTGVDSSNITETATVYIVPAWREL